MDAVRNRLTSALVTASYRPDLERCRLLCETIDRHVTGHSHHYLLVASNDVAAFRTLEGSRRTVVDERDLLPGWLRSYPDPLSRFRKRIWLSPRTMPLRGWHVQQLRRIAIAGQVREDGLIFCDSDVAVLRPFDCNMIWRNGALRLFRRENGLSRSDLDDQRLWAANAGRTLGLTAAPRHDYIATVIAWRRESALAMCRHIEDLSGKHWVAAIGSNRHFSECMLYGRYADEVMQGQGHFHESNELCRVYWTGPALSDDTFSEFVSSMTPDQVAIGMQSFIGTDIGRIRRMISA
jgi:hypothetical protein